MQQPNSSRALKWIPLFFGFLICILLSAGSIIIRAQEKNFFDKKWAGKYILFDPGHGRMRDLQVSPPAPGANYCEVNQVYWSKYTYQNSIYYKNAANDVVSKPSGIPSCDALGDGEFLEDCQTIKYAKILSGLFPREVNLLFTRELYKRDEADASHFIESTDRFSNIFTDYPGEPGQLGCTEWTDTHEWNEMDAFEYIREVLKTTDPTNSVSAKIIDRYDEVAYPDDVCEKVKMEAFPESFNFPGQDGFSGSKCDDIDARKYYANYANPITLGKVDAFVSLHTDKRSTIWPGTLIIYQSSRYGYSAESKLLAETIAARINDRIKNNLGIDDWTINIWESGNNPKENETWYVDAVQAPAVIIEFANVSIEREFNILLDDYSNRVLMTAVRDGLCDYYDSCGNDVFGNVRDFYGYPIVGAQVTLDNDAYGAETTTDSNGNYRFSDVPSNRQYVLNVEMEGCAFQEGWARRTITLGFDDLQVNFENGFCRIPTPMPSGVQLKCEYLWPEHNDFSCTQSPSRCAITVSGIQAYGCVPGTCPAMQAAIVCTGANCAQRDVYVRNAGGVSWDTSLPPNKPKTLTYRMVYANRNFGQYSQTVPLGTIAEDTLMPFDTGYWLAPAAWQPAKAPGHVFMKSEDTFGSSRIGSTFGMAYIMRLAGCNEYPVQIELQGGAPPAAPASKPMLLLALDQYLWDPFGLGAGRWPSMSSTQIYVYDGDVFTGYMANVNSLGRALLWLPEGNYRFLVEYDGRQYWSGPDNQCAIPDCIGAIVNVGDFVMTEEHIERVSVAPAKVEANNESGSPTISDDGRFVAFMSWANNLISGDTNDSADIYLVDRNSDSISRISKGPLGAQADCYSTSPKISGDGRFIVYDSCADNLVAEDTNGAFDIFLYDRVGKETRRVSLGMDGIQANGDSRWPSISADGRYVVFASGASNLVPNDTNGIEDIFIRDLIDNTTERVSEGLGSGQGNQPSRWPVISADGNFVAFVSYADNLVENDTNGVGDIFRWNRLSKEIIRVSISSDGVQGDLESYSPTISSDGNRIAFASLSGTIVSPGSGFVDIFLRDISTGLTTRISRAADGGFENNHSYNPQISSNGRYITFSSFASNLIDGDTNAMEDVFLYDLQEGIIVRISVLSDGLQGNGASSQPGISAEGGFIVFQSAADNLISWDRNGKTDIFVFSAEEIVVLPTPTWTRTPTPSNTPTETLTPTITNTPSITRTPSDTLTPTETMVPSLTFTSSSTKTPTYTPSRTDTSTETPLPSDTPTPTPTATETPVPSLTPTPSSTSTHTPTRTPTPTVTDTPIPSETPTDSPTPTFSPTASDTPKSTDTRTPTRTESNTPTSTNSASPSSTSSSTPSRTATPTSEPTIKGLQGLLKTLYQEGAIKRPMYVALNALANTANWQWNRGHERVALELLKTMERLIIRDKGKNISPQAAQAVITYLHELTR